MNLPVEFRDLPLWAALLVILFGLSFVLGVVSAGIAIGIELGSALAGVVAVLGGLALVVLPVVAYLMATGAGESAGAESSVESDDRMDALRERYVAGEIDEETFETRMEELLDSPEGDATGSGGRERDASDEPGRAIE